MTDPRWERVEEAFSRAVERPEEEWDAILEEACGGDAALRREVLGLLRGVAPSSRYMDDLAARIGLPREPAGTVFDGEAEGGRSTIGPYRVVRLLGRGGMGAVYLGEREEDGFRLQAAIKVVAAGIESGSARERFLLERRILATLRHPHIASLFDGGFTEDGTPYFVMEYVEGLPIHRYCDDHALPVQARVELLLQVAGAVQHAHQNLVIHRDLKPQNVLVTGDGDVKLLDFGIARLLDAAEGEFLTATALPHPMTVAWASPEQLRGLPVSTATDVYGLGLLLYQLVTGRQPYDLNGSSLANAERVICETDPLPPHRAVERGGDTSSPDGGSRSAPDIVEAARRRGVSPARLRRQLSGDLERILLMALRKEPGRRYPSVEALAEDLRRYLAGLPVAARPDSRRYRMARFVSRNRGAVVAGGAVAVLALSLVGLGVRYTLETRANALRLEQEAATTQAVTDFLVSTLSLADPSEGAGDTLTVRSALERGVKEYGELLAERPELRARMLETMARAYLGLGLEPEATALLEEAVALQPPTGEPTDTMAARRLLKLADAHFASGRFEDALASADEARAVLEGAGADSAALAVALGVMAKTLARVERVDSARALGGRALGILRRHAGPDDLRTQQVTVKHAVTLRMAEEPDSAETLYRGLLERWEISGAPDGPMGPEVANNLGFLLSAQKRFGEAAAMYRLALERYGRWMAATERLTTLNNLASVLDQEGDAAGAEAALRERLDFARSHWPGGHWRVGSAAASVAMILRWNGRTAEAEPFLREAAESYAGTLGPDHGWTANAESLLGEALAELGRPEEAEPLLVGSFERLLAGPGPEDRWTLAALGRLASFLEERGRGQEATRQRARIAGGG